MNSLPAISVFGLGYVGTVVCACLARKGHRVIGVDTDPGKVALLGGGRSPIVERDVEPMIAEAVGAGRLTATTDHEAAVRDTSLSLICVGTPSRPSGELDLRYVERVAENIGQALATKTGYHLVVVRSTVVPGTTENLVAPALARASGRRLGEDFGVAMNPEFLRESTAVQDFYQPPKTVIGAAGERDASLVAALYEGLPGPMIRTDIRVAETVKYADNCFHALKITFANEIGSLCAQLGVDSRAVMEVFCQDRKLNLSPAYLKPGFAYGGSCLPKDLRALNWLARSRDLELPLLGSLARSNELLVQRAVQRVLAAGKRRVGILGFAFKSGTDDLRESPVVTVIEALLGKGAELKIYDGSVSLARLVGANRRYLEEHIPHISRLMVGSVDEVLAHGEVIVLGNDAPEFFTGLGGLPPDRLVLDLTIHPHRPATPATYERLTG